MNDSNTGELTWVKLTWELYYPSALPPARPIEISFWWRDCLKVLPTFKNLVVCTFAQGNSILLWKDKWTDVPLQEAWPHLFSFAKNDSISLKKVIAATDLSNLFYLLVSKEAMVQLNLFQAMLQELMPTNDSDSWTVLGSASVKVSFVY
jgi:hypothetical protein